MSPRGDRRGQHTKAAAGEHKKTLQYPPFVLYYIGIMCKTENIQEDNPNEAY